MTDAAGRRWAGLFIFILLGLSGCHLDSASSPHRDLSVSSFDHLLLTPVDDDIAQHPHTAAQTLITRLEQQAGMVITPVSPEPAALPEPSPAPRLPPLPVRSHLSVFSFISPQGDVTADYFITDRLPVTPDVPVLFTELDPFGTGLGFDMGLTDPHLPLSGTADWPLTVQAFCRCPQATGIHRTTDARARLDFASGRFRLNAEFTGTNLRTAGMDMRLDRTSLLNRKGQLATTELSFADRRPVQLDGELHLYLSGRTAEHIGGQFSSAAPMDLSDILFMMQFVSRRTAP